jgi:hypothetical protein
MGGIVDKTNLITWARYHSKARQDRGTTEKHGYSVNSSSKSASQALKIWPGGKEEWMHWQGL